MINFVKIWTLNTCKKNHGYVFLIFFNFITLIIHHKLCITFSNFLTQLIKFYWHLQRKKLNTKNVSQRLKTSQNILKILLSVGNDKIRIWRKFQISTVF